MPEHDDAWGVPPHEPKPATDLTGIVADVDLREEPPNNAAGSGGILNAPKPPDEANMAFDLRMVDRPPDDEALIEVARHFNHGGLFALEDALHEPEEHGSSPTPEVSVGASNERLGESGTNFDISHGAYRAGEAGPADAIPTPAAIAPDDPTDPEVGSVSVLAHAETRYTLDAPRLREEDAHTDAPHERIPHASETKSTRHDAETVVAQFLDDNEIGVSADGELSIPEESASTYDEIAEVSVAEAPGVQEILDRIILRGCGIKSSLLARALRQEIRKRAKARKKELVRAITAKPTDHERRHGWALLENFVSKVFEGDPAVNAGGLGHFMHQVKRKLAKLEVSDHMAPIFVSPSQGVGKSRTVKRMLALFAELAKPGLLSDIADPRSIYVFRRPIIVLDDMERIHPADVPILKGRITGEFVNGRIMHTNRDGGTAQLATFIGTANRSVAALIPDESGHRRFFEMTFRNGNPATGGDPQVWNTINATDFAAIWRSIDPFLPSPLEAVRDKVLGPDRPQAQSSAVHAWAAGLAVDSEEFSSLVEGKGVPARSLYDYYGETTKDVELSETAFGIAMKRATFDERVPFHYPKRHKGGYVYKLRRPKP